jgi:hypothetical protein
MIVRRPAAVSTTAALSLAPIATAPTGRATSAFVGHLNAFDSAIGESAIRRPPLVPTAAVSTRATAEILRRLAEPEWFHGCPID